MKKYWVNKVINFKNESLRGFYIILDETKEIAKIEIPSDIYGDKGFLYEEEILFEKETFKAKYEDGNFIHINDGELLGTLEEWEEKVENILKQLNKDDLLNQTGRILAEHPELFPETIEEIQDYWDNLSIGEKENVFSTSSLVGPDNEKVIKDWINKDEEYIIYLGKLENEKMTLRQMDKAVLEIIEGGGSIFEYGKEWWGEYEPGKYAFSYQDKYNIYFTMIEKSENDIGDSIVVVTDINLI